MSCGLLIIATNSGGVEDIVNKETGYLLKKNCSEKTLVKKMLILSQKEKFSSQEIKRQYRKNFSPKIVINKLNKAYSGIFK